MSHKANVIKLTARPAFAHVDLSLYMAMRPITNDIGGKNNIEIPTRNPRREPHPKPGHLSNCAMTKSQGVAAKNKLVLPS